MKSLKNFLYLLGLISMFFLFSCSTVNEYAVSSDTHHRQFADISVNLRYLDRDELIARHGEDANPFIDFPGTIINSQNLMVFEMEIESTETAVLIKQKNIKLKFDTEITRPISEYHLKENWREHHENSRIKDLRNTLIGQNVSQGELEAGPDNPLSTYIVFLDKLPLYGDAVFTLPITTADFSDSGIIEFPFSFKLAYINSEKRDPRDVVPGTVEADADEEKKSIFE